MSSGKNTDDSAEKSLMTLDQLSQTIEVMTGVVSRLKRHLNMQLLYNRALTHDETDQTIELSRELLNNERELQELQQLANQQRHAVLGTVETPPQELRDVQESPVRNEGFIVEISRHDEGYESEQDRVLH
ncbi:MAG: hypothetical protein WBJ75_07270 [Pseudohongiellaceae bacterium]|nr:MAG: hypothetical protein A3H44_06275 [Gammaproteobacteria bacterium RIFCSPLOWO2_02_FULL_57_10]